jgi:hypothetical protein
LGQCLPVTPESNTENAMRKIIAFENGMAARDAEREDGARD